MTTQTETTTEKQKALHEMMQQERVIGFLWSIEDVQSLRPDLNEDQAWSVLQHLDARKDRESGITWDILDWAACDLFPRLRR